jgi:tetratricopeptide (TPR) repeat protein
MEKYADVYEVLRAALAQRPDWPTTAFQPLELYATAGEYTQMIRALDATRARHPDEPLLQFLAGYVRWLDGRRHEATELFRQAQRGLADPEAIELFLKALPDTEPI